MITLESEIQRFAEAKDKEFKIFCSLLLCRGIKLEEAPPFYGERIQLFDIKHCQTVVDIVKGCGFEQTESNSSFCSFSKNGKGRIYVAFNEDAPTDAGKEGRFQLLDSTLESFSETISTKYSVEHICTENNFNRTLAEVKSECKKVCENLYTYDEGDGTICYVSVYPEHFKILVDTHPKSLSMKE